MKPIMNDSVVVKNPKIDERGKPVKDRYGKYKFDSVVSEARVQHSIRVIVDADGQRHQSFLEIDLPAETEVSYASEITYMDNFGKQIDGKVVGINEATNLAGNKVYYRTIHIG